MSTRTAIIYDWMDKWGGVERVLLTLHDMFPDAHFFTSFVDVEGAPWTRRLHVTPSFMQRLPRGMRQNRILSLPFFSYAFESFDLNGYDTVISVSSSFAKGVIVKPPANHILYLLTPTRFLWHDAAAYARGALTMPFAGRLRRWDYIAAQRPDTIVSISDTVAARTLKYYGRASSVLYPPFDSTYWTSLKKGKAYDQAHPYYLIVSRLEPYKNVMAAVEAFNVRPQENLVIVGKGSLEQQLKSRAGTNITFVKDVTDSELAALYASAEALIMMQEEDFGYVALEATALGCPVIAYARGGAAETVLDGITGMFMQGNEPADLLNALDIFHTVSYNIRKKLRVRANAHLDTFSAESFKRRFRLLITN